MDARVRDVGVAGAATAVVAAFVFAAGYGWTKVDPMAAGSSRSSGQTAVTTSATDANEASAPAEGEPEETTGEIVGRVTDSDGSPVPGVKVWEVSRFGVELQGNWELPHDVLKPTLAETPATTDEDGRYRLEVRTTYPEGYVLAFRSPGEGKAWMFSGGAAHFLDAQAIEVPADGKTVHDLVLQRAGSIEGRVFGPGLQTRNGQSPWTLEAVRVDGEEPRLVRQVPLTSRRWTLDGLPPGTYLVAVTSEDTGDIFHQSAVRPRRATKIKVAAGAQIAGINVALRRPGRVEGRVVDRAGRPMAGVKVVLVGGWINGKGGSAADVAGSATTDGNGRWSTSVPTGDYSVHLHQTPPFNRSVEAGSVSVTAGREVSHDVTTDRRASIAGRVSVPARWQGASIGIENRQGSDWTLTAWLEYDAEDGSFSMSGLTEGTYRLVAQDSEGQPLRLVATGVHAPGRFVLRDGLVLTELDLRVQRLR
ncbi:carboxypeptidase-like regulatory domain-containing protein [Nocardioides gilvus]|uniref:carboxypeptidase-like regulatory domain-containing protein n=1 Tax=Nocardioides gilvus TaxID=1735589 RepID=UPI000D7420B6|nr:carboxypeptidase-like regulatory domain-containing protein [Nocardioides gilvus]